MPLQAASGCPSPPPGRSIKSRLQAGLEARESLHAVQMASLESKLKLKEVTAMT